MDAIEAIVKVVFMILALFAIMGGVAALFMFIFSIATGIDERIQS